MKRFLLACAAVGMSAAMVAPAAQAQRYQSINQRQGNLYNRIEQGVRNGSLNRREASRLRTRFANLSRLEHSYRRSGGRFTYNERADLNRRFDALSSAVRSQKHDRQMRR
ncbi:hypothetical protein [Sphingomonas sp.]|uniref:hypothetical protein n=1 Tax=Sphingomonas sp. TaxID=28214 RepID=UPI0035BBD094